MIIIGEKINATIKSAKEIILNQDKKKLLDLAKRQVQAGANYIDVNVATGVGSPEDEIDAMKWAVTSIQKELDKPLCIDSADPKVLEAGLDVVKGSVLINSTTAEDKMLKQILPLAKRYNAPIVCLAMDEKGISKTVDGRLNACKKIAEACKEEGIGLDSVYFDPLVMPISTDATQGLLTLHTITAIKKEFPEAGTVLGLSNISFGLPDRININASFLQMAIYSGLNAAFLDPIEVKIISAIKTAEAIIGKDRHFRRYIRSYRNSSIKSH
ncbi:5-methyltetrahydrofolate corrinoid/iron sulfur protein methyltransferase [Candidatus Magnetomoraceae bacterium gMMP-15]